MSNYKAQFRYNTELKMPHFASFIAQIKNNQALYVKDSIGNRKIYYVKYKHIPYKVVYDHETNYIVTALPFDTEEYNKLKERKEQKLKELRKEIQCPKCGYKYTARPQNRFVQCLEHGCHSWYHQKTEVVGQTMQWIKESIYRCKG